MAMESFATPYPVIFYDGEQEHDKGQIGVHSVLTFKRFQALLSQKTGLPANQLSAVFVCRRTLKDTDKRQKLPINENTNFNIILNQHNPIREKDCHFLVSLKKSKKERKGTTRRRNTEAENGDEDESASSRGDVSPPDERPKLDEFAEDASEREAVSINLQDVQPPFQGIVENLKRQSSTTSPDVNLVRVGNGKIMLRREVAGYIGPSPSGGWHGGRQVERQEAASPAVFSTLDGNAQQGTLLPPQKQEDAQPLDKRWIQNGSSNGRPADKASQSLPGQSSQLNGITSRPLQSKNNDAFPTIPTSSGVVLQRSGTLTPMGAVTSAGSLLAVPTLQPLTFSAVEAAIPRVSTVGSGGYATGTSGALNLQQAQTHYLNVQKEHSGNMHMSSRAFSKLQGVVRELAAIDTGLGVIDSGMKKISGVCRYCYAFKERNINPTPFHLCVHDRVTNGFRGPSPAGPIERPVKRLEAAA